MAFNWNEYIEFARNLKDSNKEVELRVSISRGYYGVFHELKRFKNLNPKDHITHINLIKKLKTDDDVDYVELGTNLHKLKKHRENADYHLLHEINKEKNGVFHEC